MIKQKGISICPVGKTTKSKIEGYRNGKRYCWELNFPEMFVIEGHHVNISQADVNWKEIGNNILAMHLKTRKFYVPTNKESLKMFAHKLYSIIENRRWIVNKKVSLECDLFYKTFDDYIEIILSVKNKENSDWHYCGEAMACLQNFRMREFVDPTGERTFVNINGKLISISSISDILNPYRKHWMTGYYVEGEKIHPNFQKQNEYLVDDSFISTTNQNDEVVGLYWQSSHRVSANFRTLNCIHSNPKISPLKSNEVFVNYGRIYFYQTSKEALRHRISNDFRPEKVKRRINYFKELGISKFL